MCELLSTGGAKPTSSQARSPPKIGQPAHGERPGRPKDAVDSPRMTSSWSVQRETKHPGVTSVHTVAT